MNMPEEDLTPAEMQATIQYLADQVALLRAVLGPLMPQAHSHYV